MNFKKFPTVTIICGLPGSGKTTTAAHLCRVAHRKKCAVFSNFPLKYANKFLKDDFGCLNVSGSKKRPTLLLLDEAGIDWNNRDFKNSFGSSEKGKRQLEFLKLLRHYHCKLVIFSQTWSDMDLKMRSMCGKVYIATKSVFPLSTALTPVHQKIDVDKETHDFKDMYSKDFLLIRPFTTRHVFRPLYYHMFDSFDAPALPDDHIVPWYHTESKFKHFVVAVKNCIVDKSISLVDKCGRFFRRKFTP